MAVTKNCPKNIFLCPKKLYFCVVVVVAVIVVVVFFACVVVIIVEVFVLLSFLFNESSILRTVTYPPLPRLGKAVCYIVD